MTTRAPFEQLDDYQTGEMSDADAQGFEEELFAAAAAGASAEAAFVDQVSRIGAFLLPRGGFDIGSSRARVDALIARGLRVQLCTLGPDDLIDGVYHLPKIDDDAEIVATHFPLDLRGYDSVNVVIEKADGTPIKTFREVGWDPTDGSAYAVCEAPLARISAAIGQVRSTVIGKRGDREHVIATFESVNAQ